MSDAVRSMFATIAPRYDAANRLLSAGRDVAWRRHCLARLSGEPQRILDLACGTYDCALDLRRRFPQAQIHAADFCLPMLQAGESKRSGTGISATAGDALHLPYGSGSFDAAVIAYGWRNVDHPAAALAELARVLSPQGELLILEFFRPTRLWPKFFYASFGRFLFPAIGGLTTGNAEAYRYLRRSVRQFLSLAEAEAALVAAGFQAPQIYRYFGGISHALIARRDGAASC